ncbi:MAG: energy transducer TonB, partial [Verrucomicrobiia bacterium]
MPLRRIAIFIGASLLLHLILLATLPQLLTLLPETKPIRSNQVRVTLLPPPPPPPPPPDQPPPP